jgi:4-hydroxy-tetrahydrodipicolinate synthase
MPLVGPVDHEAALIEDSISRVKGIAGIDLAKFRPDRAAAAGGALPTFAREPR